MSEIENLIRNFISIFLGIVIAITLSQECLIQPNIISI